MQVLVLNSVVATRKTQENFYLPDDLKAAADMLVEQVGKKRKWVVYTAALIALLEEEADARWARFRRIMDADTDKNFRKLLPAPAAPANLITLETVEGGVVGIPTEEPPPESPASQPPRRKGEWHRRKRQRRPRPGTPNSP
jgi:hypothetical protein